MLRFSTFPNETEKETKNIACHYESKFNLFRFIYFLITHLGASAGIDVSNITKDLHFYAFFKETELIGRIAASLVDTNGALTLRTTAQDIQDGEREREKDRRQT